MTDQELAAVVVRGGRLRALVLELWQRTRIDWGFVTDRLAAAFRKEKWLGAHERRFVGEVLYGLVRHLRRVDAAITRGRRSRGDRAPRDLERLFALLVVEKLIEPAACSRELPDLDWAAVAGVDDAIAGERRALPRIALGCSLPDWLAARLIADYGEAEAEALARGLNQRAPMTVRANLLVGTRAEASEAMTAENIASHDGKWCDTALVVDTRTNLFALKCFERGMIEVQDEGSQLLADVASAVAAAAAGGRPNVVDYCAGAGGKTLAIAGRLANRGRILATDVDGNKLEELRRRARRAGVTTAQAVSLGGPGGASGRSTGNAWPQQVEALRGKADVVLVDAPCSGIGALRRNPEARWRLREADLAGFAARQIEIVRAAMMLCAPTGRVVYATCSLLACENAEVVAALAPVARPVPLRDYFGEARAASLGDGNALVVAPHRHGTDGFFAQVLAPAA